MMDLTFDPMYIYIKNQLLTQGRQNYKVSVALAISSNKNTSMIGEDFRGSSQQTTARNQHLLTITEPI